MKFAAFALAVLSAGSLTACAAPDPASELADIGTAEQAWGRRLYVTQVAMRAGTVFFISPLTLATATDGWGPQTLSLSLAQGFSPEVSYSTSPGISVSRNDITTSLSSTLGFSLSTTITLVASTTVLVPTEAYYRVEAYPEYEVIDWSLRAEAVGLLPDVLVAAGSVYRPVGVHFRALKLVGGEWNAISPPSLGEIASVPPWAPAGAIAAATTATDAGARPAFSGGAGPSTPAGGATSPTAPGSAAGVGAGTGAAAASAGGAGP